MGGTPSSAAHAAGSPNQLLTRGPRDRMLLGRDRPIRGVRSSPSGRCGRDTRIDSRRIIAARWNRDGTQLYYLRGGEAEVMRVPVTTTIPLRTGQAQALFAFQIANSAVDSSDYDTSQVQQTGAPAGIHNELAPSAQMAPIRITAQHYAKLFFENWLLFALRKRGGLMMKRIFVLAAVAVVALIPLKAI